MQLELKSNRLFLFSAVATAWLVCQSVVRSEVTITPVGTPVFNLVDSHLFAADTDAFFSSIFPQYVPPRQVIAPPYDQQFSNGLALAGINDKEEFSVSEFSAPSAVHLGYVLVPQANAPTGSTPDYGSGPMIPNNVMPITARGDVLLNGATFELNAFGLNIPVNSTFDGWSHLLLEHWENSDFAPPDLESLVGDYEYRLTIRDVQNNGFDVVARFSVVPEPVSMAPLALGAMFVLLGARRRRNGVKPE